MINLPYTVFVELPIYRNKQGQLFCDSLWAKDLRLHLTYIGHFSLCCPVIKGKIPQGFEDITEENIDDIDIKQVFELRHCVGFISTFTNFFFLTYLLFGKLQNTAKSFTLLALAGLSPALFIWYFYGHLCALSGW